MPIFRDGEVNLAGLTNPGAYVGIVPPTPFVTGNPTNIEAAVGVASWGPVNTVAAFSTYDDGVALYGLPQVRFADLMTSVAAACLGGDAIAFRGVRVTDGTDTAASATIPSSGGTATARYTGSRGNQIGLTFQATSGIGAVAAVVSFPGRAPERFENIYKGLAALTVTAGSGYTSPPTLAFTPPQVVGGVTASARTSLKVVTATVAAGGSGYVVGNTITLPNGVVLTVATVSSGAVATATITNAGSITAGTAPTNPVAQVGTNGSGTGATFTLSWGFGNATITPGSGYTSAPTLTVTGGGAGTGGSYASPVVSFWAALAGAINNGTPQRSRSNYVVFTAGSGTGDPVLNTPYTLAGGTDGAQGVGSAQLVGSDASPRTGMYALRGSGMDSFQLVDCTDTATWSPMLALAKSEGSLAIFVTAPGDTIAGAVATRISTGLDDPYYWLLQGDWPTFYDAANGSRLVTPAAIAQGLLGNLSPEQSPINKPLVGVAATQASQTGVLTSSAEEAVANTGGIDFIGRSADLGASYFSFMTGRNGSSNTAANGVEYTRLTNFLASALSGAATRSIVGQLQSIRANDPTRERAKAVLDSFFQALKQPAFGTNGYGLIDDAGVTCDLTNNSPTTIARGYLFAFCAVRYLNVVRYFVIRLAGGGNVQVSVQNTQPTLASLIQIAA